MDGHFLAEDGFRRDRGHVRDQLEPVGKQARDGLVALEKGRDQRVFAERRIDRDRAFRLRDMCASHGTVSERRLRSVR